MSAPALFRELALVANVRIPSERAHVLQIMHMAAAFSTKFERVRLVYPIRANTDAMKRVGDVFDHYGVRAKFGLVGLPCIDAVKRVTIDWGWLASSPLPLLAHVIQIVTFSFAALLYVLRLPPCIIYSRDLLTLTVLNVLSTGRNRLFIVEIHTLPRSEFARGLHLWAARRADGIVAISDHIRDWYLERGFDEDLVIVARDGVDIDAYASLPDRNTARSRIGIDLDSSVACYTGHFYPWKGVDDLAACARYLSEDWRLFLVGGIDPDLERLRSFADADERIHVVDHLPARDAALYLAASDVAVLPNSARADISARFTSPLKLFEYLASGRPVVATDVPAVREIVGDADCVHLVEPDNPQALADGLKRVAHDTALRDRITANATGMVRDYSWDSRAILVADFIRTLV